MTNEKLTPELIERARNVQSPEELIALANENGIEMPQEKAEMFYSQLHSQNGEISDDELDNVAGGKGCLDGREVRVHKKCGNRCTYMGVMDGGWYCEYCHEWPKKKDCEIFRE